MAQMSQWFANEILKIAFNRDTYTPGWTQFEVAALLSEPPSESDILLLSEPTFDPAYSRPLVPFLTQSWTLGQLGEVYNTNAIVWPAASVNWGPITNYALIASSFTGGFTAQLALVGNFPAIPQPGVGDQLRLPAQSVFFGLYDGH